MGDKWLDEMVTLEQFMATKSKATNDLMKTRREWLTIFSQYADSSGGIQTLLNSSGQMTEASASTIATNTGTAATNTGTTSTLAGNQIAGNPISFTVGGTVVAGTNPWLPFAPLTRTADASGNPGAAAEIVAASAGKLIEVMIWAQASAAATSGCYKLRYCQKTGTPGAVAPPWGGLVTPIPLGGVFPVSTWGIRLSTTTASENFGVGTGVNADYTNNASVTFFGFYRYI